MKKVVKISQKTIREIIMISLFLSQNEIKILCNLVDKFLGSIGLSCIFV